MRIHQPPKRPVTRLADVPMGGVFRLHETDFRFFMITKAGIIDLANGEIRDPETFAASAGGRNAAVIPHANATVRPCVARDYPFPKPDNF